MLVKGTITCVVKACQGVTRAEIIVIQGKGAPLLKRHSFEAWTTENIGIDFAALSEVNMKSQYPSVFGGVGKLKSRRVTLYIDPKVKPAAQTFRRTPFNLRGKVSDKIKKLLDKDIIEPVESSTPWVNPVIVPIALCINMRRKNPGGGGTPIYN